MIKVTLHQLNVLKMVKMHGSITEAARALHITQPAVSNILKQLESAHQETLTETIGKKVFLTQAGGLLVEAAEKINAILEGASSEINALHGKLLGKMTVAIVSTAKYFVPKLLGEFQRKYPAINIKLIVCNRGEAIQILKNNQSDFLVMSQPPKELAVNTELFYEDQLVVASSPELTFYKPVKELKDLSKENWIIREEGSGTRIVMNKLFKQHHMPSNITMEVGNNESIKQLIMANMGISIISKQSIELELKHRLLQIISIHGFPLKHPWYFVTNKGKHLTRVTKEFFAFAKKYRQ